MKCSSMLIPGSVRALMYLSEHTFTKFSSWVLVILSCSYNTAGSGERGRGQQEVRGTDEEGEKGQ